MYASIYYSHLGCGWVGGRL